MGDSQDVLLEEVGEERLRRILSFVDIAKAAACEGVERVPVSLAEDGQGLVGCRHAPTARRQHQAPARAGELARAFVFRNV